MGRQAKWYRSITPTGAPTAAAGGDVGGVRIHDFHSMTPDSAGRALDRVYRRRDLVVTARDVAARDEIASLLEPVGNPIGPDRPGLGGGGGGPVIVPNRPMLDEEGIPQPSPGVGTTPAPQPAPSTSNPQTGMTAPPGGVGGGEGSSLLDMPDTTGHGPGDVWSGTMLDGRPVQYSIPDGNGSNTVDLEITNPDKTVDRWRIATNETGGLQHWHDDADGQSSYAGRSHPGQDWYLQSFTPGNSTSGAPSREFTAEANLSKVYTPSFDAAANYVGTDVGVRNGQGLYDNHFVDPANNITSFKTVPNDRGGYDNVQVGWRDHTGHGWRIDEWDRRWEEYVDDSGKPASRRYDPVTGQRGFVYREGDNTRHDTIDSSGRIIESLLLGPDDVVISSLTRDGGLLVSGSRNAQGKFVYTFRDEKELRTGTLSMLPGGGIRLSYNDNEVVELDAAGRETKRYDRISGRTWQEIVGQQFRASGRAVGRGAAGFAEGLSGLAGLNDVVNAVGTVTGGDFHLATRQEVLTGMEDAFRSFYHATRHFHMVSIVELTRYRAGTQDLSTTWDHIEPSFLNALNEESKVLIGADWHQFHDTPGATLGTAAFGLATWFVPAKVPRFSRQLLGEGGAAASRSTRGPQIPPSDLRGPDGRRNPALGRFRNLTSNTPESIRSVLGRARDWSKEKISQTLEVFGEGLMTTARVFRGDAQPRYAFPGAGTGNPFDWTSNQASSPNAFAMVQGSGGGAGKPSNPSASGVAEIATVLKAAGRPELAHLLNQLLAREAKGGNVGGLNDWLRETRTRTNDPNQVLDKAAELIELKRLSDELSADSEIGVRFNPGVQGGGKSFDILVERTANGVATVERRVEVERMKDLPVAESGMRGPALHGAEKVKTPTPGRVPTAETTVVVPKPPAQGRIVPGKHSEKRFHWNGMDYDIYAGGIQRGPTKNLLDDLAKEFNLNEKKYQYLPSLDAVNFVDENGSLLGRIVRGDNGWKRERVS
ncbi:hypothetical protein [Nocardia aurea]|uniref:hypothetical protein n=1 Tax=Nocardia aurea TaxID=2144174 RepID=UPI0013002F64|nr:hypothetical protein [Nocardia aurea]